MSHLKDLRGETFGRWTVIDGPLNRKQNMLKWFCQCECGTLRAVNGHSLRRGLSTSCGCAKSERMINDNPVHHRWARELR